MREFFSSLFWPTLTGILAAAIILDQWVLPEPLGRERGQVKTSYSDAVALATPSVVNIYTAKLVDSGRSQSLNDPLLRRFLGNSGRRQRVERSLGSGVILTPEGHIITNNHVIADADAIQVLLHDGRSAKATAIGSDPATDLAVLQIQLPGLTPITLANSDKAKVGDVVLAIGNPYGFGHSVSQGIISGLSRYGLQASDYEDYIQTDASVLLGSSGGALIDASGKLLGINTLIYTANGEGTDDAAIGINLATPVNLAHFVMKDLVNYGTVVRGWLGVSVELLQTPETIAQQQQVLLVSGLAEDGPAARAGLRLGDVISAINGNTVNDGRITMHQIARFRPGEIVDIEVARGRQQEPVQLQAVVGTRPEG
ncbi:trypsin-like peptidase domain-containing protein [Luminiphilus sp.]|nr:trypsin-like peptidase domain-containing protein [Luminiphilus sp.]MDB4581783.1 trypsin-like peptidase domain-containing protein [Draconibacterium sp.]MDA8772971.1 trypsin-like peptidase domain-containing protein [Luminiphilus sp.]MDA9580063.1 trypsin-like peptidase domain-containing protein [Luminiphilus sp.]MDA9847427.1 trypsin-like peptidase domain-containing protein [Luminiphilus sp.]